MSEETQDPFCPDYRGPSRRYQLSDFGLSENEQFQHPRILRDVQYDTIIPELEEIQRAEPKRPPYQFRSPRPSPSRSPTASPTGEIGPPSCAVAAPDHGIAARLEALRGMAPAVNPEIALQYRILRDRIERNMCTPVANQRLQAVAPQRLRGRSRFQQMAVVEAPVEFVDPFRQSSVEAANMRRRLDFNEYARDAAVERFREIRDRRGTEPLPASAYGDLDPVLRFRAIKDVMTAVDRSPIRDVPSPSGICLPPNEAASRSRSVSPGGSSILQYNEMMTDDVFGADQVASHIRAATMPSPGLQVADISPPQFPGSPLISPRRSRSLTREQLLDISAPCLVSPGLTPAAGEFLENISAPSFASAACTPRRNLSLPANMLGDISAPSFASGAGSPSFMKDMLIRTPQISPSAYEERLGSCPRFPSSPAIAGAPPPDAGASMSGMRENHIGFPVQRVNPTAVARFKEFQEQMLNNARTPVRVHTPTPAASAPRRQAPQPRFIAPNIIITPPSDAPITAAQFHAAPPVSAEEVCGAVAPQQIARKRLDFASPARREAIERFQAIKARTAGMGEPMMEGRLEGDPIARYRALRNNIIAPPQTTQSFYQNFEEVENLADISQPQMYESGASSPGAFENLQNISPPHMSNYEDLDDVSAPSAMGGASPSDRLSSDVCEFNNQELLADVSPPELVDMPTSISTLAQVSPAECLADESAPPMLQSGSPLEFEQLRDVSPPPLPKISPPFRSRSLPQLPDECIGDVSPPFAGGDTPFSGIGLEGSRSSPAIPCGPEEGGQIIKETIIERSTNADGEVQQRTKHIITRQDNLGNITKETKETTSEPRRSVAAGKSFPQQTPTTHRFINPPGRRINFQSPDVSSLAGTSSPGAFENLQNISPPPYMSSYEDLDDVSAPSAMGGASPSDLLSSDVCEFINEELLADVSAPELVDMPTSFRTLGQVSPSECLADESAPPMLQSGSPLELEQLTYVPPPPLPDISPPFRSRTLPQLPDECIGDVSPPFAGGDTPFSGIGLEGSRSSPAIPCGPEEGGQIIKETIIERSTNADGEVQQCTKHIITRQDNLGNITKETKETTSEPKRSVAAGKSFPQQTPTTHRFINPPGRRINFQSPDVSSLAGTSSPGAFENLQNILPPPYMSSYEDLDDVSAPSAMGGASPSDRLSSDVCKFINEELLADVSAPELVDMPTSFRTLAQVSPSECLADESAPPMLQSGSPLELEQLTYVSPPPLPDISPPFRSRTLPQLPDECIGDVSPPFAGGDTPFSGVGLEASRSSPAIPCGPEEGGQIIKETIIERSTKSNGEVQQSRKHVITRQDNFGNITKETKETTSEPRPLVGADKSFPQQTPTTHRFINPPGRRINFQSPDVCSTSESPVSYQELADVTPPSFAASGSIPCEDLANISAPPFGNISMSPRRSPSLPAEQLANISAPSFASSPRGSELGECLEDISAPSFASSVFQGKTPRRNFSLPREQLDDISCPSLGSSPEPSSAEGRNAFVDRVAGSCVGKEVEMYINELVQNVKIRLGQVSPRISGAVSPTPGRRKSTSLPRKQVADVADSIPRECLEDISAPSYASGLSGVSSVHRSLPKEQLVDITAPGKCLEDISAPSYASGLSGASPLRRSLPREQLADISAPSFASSTPGSVPGECLEDISAPSYASGLSGASPVHRSLPREQLVDITAPGECLEDISAPFYSSGLSGASPVRRSLPREQLADTSAPSIAGSTPGEKVIRARSPGRRPSLPREQLADISAPFLVSSTDSPCPMDPCDGDINPPEPITSAIRSPQRVSSRDLSLPREQLADVSMPSFASPAMASPIRKSPCPVRSPRTVVSLPSEELADISAPSLASSAGSPSFMEDIRLRTPQITLLPEYSPGPPFPPRVLPISDECLQGDPATRFNVLRERMAQEAARTPPRVIPQICITSDTLTRQQMQQGAIQRRPQVDPVVAARFRDLKEEMRANVRTPIPMRSPAPADCLADAPIRKRARSRLPAVGGPGRRAVPSRIPPPGTLCLPPEGQAVRSRIPPPGTLCPPPGGQAVGSRIPRPGTICPPPGGQAFRSRIPPPRTLCPPPPRAFVDGYLTPPQNVQRVAPSANLQRRLAFDECAREEAIERFKRLQARAADNQAVSGQIVAAAAGDPISRYREIRERLVPKAPSPQIVDSGRGQSLPKELLDDITPPGFYSPAASTRSTPIGQSVQLLEDVSPPGFYSPAGSTPGRNQYGFSPEERLEDMTPVLADTPQSVGSSICQNLEDISAPFMQYESVGEDLAEMSPPSLVNSTPRHLSLPSERLTDISEPFLDRTPSSPVHSAFADMPNYMPFEEQIESPEQPSFISDFQVYSPTGPKCPFS